MKKFLKFLGFFAMLIGVVEFVLKAFGKGNEEDAIEPGVSRKRDYIDLDFEDEE